MHTVEMLERLESVAAQAGYTVRHEWLGGAGGGACEFAGQKWIFVDLSLSVVDQLDQLSGALKHEPEYAQLRAGTHAHRPAKSRLAA